MLANVEAILGSVQVLALDVPTDAGYDSIRVSLEAAGKPIRPKDLLIAAHAWAAGAVLITANTSELIRVPGLHVEDWLA